jgi:hypothetical protein
VVAADEVRQVALVGDVEEDGAHTGQHGDHEQLDHRQVSGPPGHRHATQQHGPAQVARDQHLAATQPVDPGAGRQTDEQEGEGLAGGEHADLEVARLQRQHRDQWQREHAHLGAELADGVGHEELAEVELPQQTQPPTFSHGSSLRH